MMIQIALPGILILSFGFAGALLFCGLYGYTVGYRKGREYGESSGYLRGKGENTMRAYERGYEHGLAERELCEAA